MKIFASAYLIAMFCHALGASPEVETPLGKIEGVMSQIEDVPVKKFLGIPYAKPPVGSLRFLKPEPVESWSGTLKATKQPPACMQYTEQPFPWYDDMPGKSEDCLYLNIYAPFFATRGSNLAVLFWIHGGSYTVGSIRMDLYDGSALAEREGVVVVTINYRLGLFGFLTTNTSDAPGNMGMYDAVMALQWVNNNIEYFGGDKDRITLVGESAGSSAVSLLCVSPLTNRLFSRAIMQSASIVKHKYNKLEYNLNLTERLAEAVNCGVGDLDFTIYDHPKEVVECLRYRNATFLTKTMWSLNPLSMRSFYPQYGDTLLPNNAVDDIRNGNFHNVPILIGTVKDEGSFDVSTSHPDEFGFFGEKDPEINKTYARTLLKGVFRNYTDPQKYIDFYLEDVPDNDYEQIRKQVTTAYGDNNILCPTVYFAESYAERNNDVYYYFFTYRPLNTPWAEWMGVVHFEDVQFVFGRPVRVPKDYNEREVWLSERMMEIWASFAKVGHPGVRLHWPKYFKGDRTYLHIDTDTFAYLDIGPHFKNCNFLRSYFGL